MCNIRKNNYADAVRDSFLLGFYCLLAGPGQFCLILANSE